MTYTSQCALARWHDRAPANRIHPAHTASLMWTCDASSLTRVYPTHGSRADTEPFSRKMQLHSGPVHAEQVLEQLAGAGVRFIAMRCAGFDKVDLPAAERLGIQVARVPSYSPHSVAEHAVAMLLCLNRYQGPSPFELCSSISPVAVLHEHHSSHRHTTQASLVQVTPGIGHHQTIA